MRVKRNHNLSRDEKLEAKDMMKKIAAKLQRGSKIDRSIGSSDDQNHIVDADLHRDVDMLRRMVDMLDEKLKLDVMRDDNRRQVEEDKRMAAEKESKK